MASQILRLVRGRARRSHVPAARSSVSDVRVVVPHPRFTLALGVSNYHRIQPRLINDPIKLSHTMQHTVPQGFRGSLSSARTAIVLPVFWP